MSGGSSCVACVYSSSTATATARGLILAGLAVRPLAPLKACRRIVLTTTTAGPREQVARQRRRTDLCTSNGACACYQGSKRQCSGEMEKRKKNDLSRGRTGDLFRAM